MTTAAYMRIALIGLCLTASAGWADSALAENFDTSGPGYVDREVLDLFTVEETTFVLDAPDGMRRFGEQAQNVVQEHWAAIAQLAGAPAGATVTVSVEREIDAWFERRNQPPRNPEWAAGLAISSQNAIIVRSGSQTWQDTLRHELAHIAVGLASGEQRVPVWFNEGFAVATAEQWSLDRAGTMMRAGLTGNFHPFGELRDRFPATSSSADLAYAQSFHLVRFVRDDHGEDVFREIMGRMREGGESWDDAFIATIGLNEAAVVVAWEDYVTSRYKWAPATLGGGGAWGVAALVMIVAYRRSKRRAQTRLAELQRIEAAQYRMDPDDEIFG
ncbi:MAG: hypothetical protein ACI82G_003169 [Bradymonadia bacterium]